MPQRSKPTPGKRAASTLALSSEQTRCIQEAGRLERQEWSEQGVWQSVTREVGVGLDYEVTIYWG